MKIMFIIKLAIISLIWSLITTAHAQQLLVGPIPLNCDRACLEKLVNDYLAAIVAHDPSRLPLSKDVRYSENEQFLDIGDGFWNTATAVGNYKHFYADPEAGQAAFIGTMIEGTNKLLYALRLRIELGRITEVETAIYRPGGAPFDGVAEMDKLSQPEAIWLDPVPAGKRATRQELIAVANAYFEGLQNNDGKGYYPFTDDCHRIENGYATTNNPSTTPNRSGFDAFALDCKTQFKSGYYRIVTRIHHRRFPVVDVERGIVYAYCIFDHAGNVLKYTLTDGREVDMSRFSRPSSIQVTEAFLIEDGLIRRVEMVGSSAPYHTNPPWEGGLSGK
ncbi:MAG: hypothetical protein HW386_2328 [Gammaproteobacteria bacterium]|nr:hypothetical protein [Gammaproteobacteria bacterium]